MGPDPLVISSSLEARTTMKRHIQVQILFVISYPGIATKIKGDDSDEEDEDEDEDEERESENQVAPMCSIISIWLEKVHPTQGEKRKPPQAKRRRPYA
ncbi:hypothetical protein JHK87_033780 [Glycine soja]|nr:hypothetical protein JHK87_033780 [Glycine soja]